MKTSSMLGVAAAGVAALQSAVIAQTTFYRLEAASQIVHEPCEGPCDCVSPPLVGPMSGGFDLVLINIGDVFDFYEVRNLEFRGEAGGVPIKLEGGGQYRESTHVAELHQMQLELAVRRGDVDFDAEFNSDFDAPLGRLFPFIDIDVPSQVVGCSRFTLRIRAAPTCHADVNYDGVVDSQDYFDFMATFFSGSTDFNRDGVTDSQDFFDFMDRFFAGC